ncbi:MAG: AmmeMemoRadiSam system protein A [Defluviitaleaceae bacterium]|nr:AmmeMemoRadiSam system protein A [Defluviitaleaceae bacterium]MCL2239770.1 AmmeMemoRadiSam system protein A [Defluviitaleaceae bacterium]
MTHAYLLPHPPLALPGIGRGEEQKIAKTLAALDEVATEIAAIAPKTLVFISPHTTVYGDYFHISPGERATGDFARFGAGDIKMAVEYDIPLGEEIARVAKENNLPAGGEGEGDPALDHGVMVPLWYICQRYTDCKILRIAPSGMDAQAHYRMGQCIAIACQNLYGNAPTVLIASGDLSHKLADRGPYGFAPEGPAFDQAVCAAFQKRDLQLLFDDAYALRREAAECGLSPCMMLAGAMHRKEVQSRLLSYEGPFGVGYAVARLAVCPYRTLARHALESRVLGNAPSLPPGLPSALTGRQAGAFVSLHMDGRLRGCIGTIAPTCDNLALEIMQNAVSAGLRDNRFSPVTTEELPQLTYKVDVLAPPEPITGPEALDVHRYGVIVTSGIRRGLLLPNLDGIDSVPQQIAIACQKAGIHATDPIELQRFEVIRHE